MKDRFDAAAIGEDGSIVLAGQSGGDFSLLKLDANGSWIWEWQVSETDARTIETPGQNLVHIVQ